MATLDDRWQTRSRAGDLSGARAERSAPVGYSARFPPGFLARAGATDRKKLHEAAQSCCIGIAPVFGQRAAPDLLSAKSKQLAAIAVDIQTAPERTTPEATHGSRAVSPIQALADDGDRLSAAVSHRRSERSDMSADRPPFRSIRQRARLDGLQRLRGRLRPARMTLTAPACGQSSAAPPASPAAIPDGTALDSPPSFAVGAGHARTRPRKAADVEQATHRQAARLSQGARGARRPDVRHATDEPGRERRDPEAEGHAGREQSSNGRSSATRSPTRSPPERRTASGSPGTKSPGTAQTVGGRIRCELARPVLAGILAATAGRWGVLWCRNCSQGAGDRRGPWWRLASVAIYSRLMQSLLSPHGVYTAADVEVALARVFGAGVRPLHLESALFEAMLSGWRSQQSARYLKAKTIRRTRLAFAGSRSMWGVGRGSGARRMWMSTSRICCRGRSGWRGRRCGRISCG